MKCKYCGEKINITDIISNWGKICYPCQETKDHIDQEKHEKEYNKREDERMEKIDQRRKYFKDE